MKLKDAGIAIVAALSSGSCSDSAGDLAKLKESAEKAQTTCDDAKSYSSMFPGNTDMKRNVSTSCELAATVSRTYKDALARHKD